MRCTRCTSKGRQCRNRAINAAGAPLLIILNGTLTPICPFHYRRLVAKNT